MSERILNRLILLTSLLTFLVTLTDLGATTPFSVNHSLNGDRLGNYIDILEDPYGILDINSVRSPEIEKIYKPADREYPSFGYTRSRYWARLRVKNDTGDSVNWVLELDTPHMDKFELYSPDASGNYSVKRIGDTLPFQEREVEYRTFIFPILEPPGANTYYMSFKTEGSMDLHLSAWSQKAFWRMVNREQPILWMFYSFILIMCCYNLFLFFSIRRYRYLFLSLFIASYLLLQMVLDGTSFQYLWPGIPWWANHSLPVAMFCCLLFSVLHEMSFLETRRFTPRFHLLMIGLLILDCAGIVLSIVLQLRPALLIAIYAAFINIGILFYAAVLYALRGYSPAKYYYFGWCLFFAGGLAHIFWTLDLLPTMIVTTRGIMIGATLMIISFSVGLGESLKKIKQEKNRLLKKLERSEEKYRGLVENLNDVIFSIDQDGRFTYISSAVRSISSHYSPEDIIGKNFVDFIHPDDLRSVMESWTRTLKGAYEPLEFRMLDRDGSTIYVRTSSRPVYDGGKPVGITGIITDITEQKRARDRLNASLAEKDALLKEVHHRVKNNLQIINSLLNLQMDNIDDARQKAALLDSQSRIYSMALIHERIYKTENFELLDFAGYIEELSGMIISSHSNDKLRVQFKKSLDPVHISLEKAVSCGLIVNELVTNCIRHAFIDKEEGTLGIFLKQNEGEIILEVEDDGRGLPDGFEPDKQETLGIRLVQILVKQIKGRLEISSDNGARFRVIFPAED